MKVLAACEESGVVRDAFIEAGHDAISCDLLPSARPGPHIQGDVTTLDLSAYDLVIAFPPCTRLANSGVRWLEERNLWGDLDDAARFFRFFLDAPVERIAIENPIPHRYAIERIGRKYDQIVQPWMFGHGETKATCLWLKNLPPLTPMCIVEGREQRVWRMPPGPNRARDRARTYPGLAKAMAQQWPAPRTQENAAFGRWE